MVIEILKNLLLFVLVVFSIVLLAFGANELEARSCEARWKDSYEYDYSVFGKCRVKVGDKFIPESNLREFDK